MVRLVQSLSNGRFTNRLKGIADEQDARAHICKSLIENMLYDGDFGSFRYSTQKLESRYTIMGVIGNRRRRELAVSGADVRVNRDVVGTKVSLSLLRSKVLSVLYCHRDTLTLITLKFPASSLGAPLSKTVYTIR